MICVLSLVVGLAGFGVFVGAISKDSPGGAATAGRAEAPRRSRQVAVPEPPPHPGCGGFVNRTGIPLRIPSGNGA
jgi:hypothetical protein